MADASAANNRHSPVADGTVDVHHHLVPPTWIAGVSPSVMEFPFDTTRAMVNLLGRRRFGAGWRPRLRPRQPRPQS